MPKYKITGSIMPGIAGLDRFNTPMDIFMKLSGLVDPQEQTWPMTLGIEQEGLIARWAANQTGLDFIEYPSTPHPVYEWAAGSPDRVVLADNIVTHGLECKFRGERLLQQYGESGTDEVLDSDMAQSCFYMGIFPQVKEWYVAVQFSNRERRLYIIKRDQELIDQFYEIAKDFLENHLIPQIPPPLDGSDSSKRWLNYRYPQDREPILEPTDNEILATIQSLQYAKSNLKHLENEIAEYENRLKAIIGDCAGMKGEWGSITWKRSKDSTVFDAKRFQATCPDLAKDFMVTKPGSRRFLAKFKEDV